MKLRKRHQLHKRTHTGNIRALFIALGQFRASAAQAAEALERMRAAFKSVHL